MNALLSLNIFAEFALAAVVGVVLFFGLLALPLFVSGEWPQAPDAQQPAQQDDACDPACP
jgi:hypothetical protein